MVAVATKPKSRSKPRPKATVHTNGKAKTKKYSFRRGARVQGVSAEVAAQELERIRKVNGGSLSPEAIVESARASSSPLHPVFEWDAEKAAYAHWLWQARNLSRSIQFVYEDQPDMEPQTFYVHVGNDDPDEQGGYQPVSIVIDSPAMFEIALSELKGKLLAAQKSCRELLSAHRKSIGPKQLGQIKTAEKAIGRAAAAVSTI